MLIWIYINLKILMIIKKFIDKINNKKGDNMLNNYEYGFQYSRRELVTIDSSFKYCNDELSGNIYNDFDNLYSNERYVDSFRVVSPLNRSYEENINEIKRNSDICLLKIGNSYKIENGRHRIIYLLKNRKEEKIPVLLTRVFEDKESNIIFKYLKEVYNAVIYKNNLLNDEFDLLININGIAYNIKNKEELILFCDNLRKDKPNDSFDKVNFNVLGNSDDLSKYKNLIFNKYLEIGSSVLIGNFTDLIKYFDNVNNLYYDAFNIMQSDYQDSLVYGYDFRKNYEDRIKKEEEMKRQFEMWDQIMGSGPENNKRRKNR